jgi:LysM repeat protein
VTDDPNAARPRRAPKRSTRRVERAPEPLPETVPEPWLEALPESSDDPAAADDWTAEDVAGDVAGEAAAVATTPDDAPPPIPEASTWLPLLEGRSPDTTICPFLRGAGSGDALGFPIEVPAVSNRCAALHETVPQSLRQQELVCLTRAHVDCPRYLRGAVVASAVPSPAVHGRTQVTPAIAASLIILGLSFTASVAFGLANGGLALPSSAVGTPVATSSVAVVEPSATPVPTAASTPAPTAATSSEPSPSLTPSPTVAPSVTSVPTTTPTTTPQPTATADPTAKPTSDRYKLLKACPDKPDCWIYKIRSGDNLFSIAKYFGVSLATVKSLNPWTKTERLKVGRELILPPPTR